MIIPIVIFVIVLFAAIFYIILSKDFYIQKGIHQERDRILDAYTESKFPIRETNKFLQKYLINPKADA